MLLWFLSANTFTWFWYYMHLSTFIILSPSCIALNMYLSQEDHWGQCTIWDPNVFRLSRTVELCLIKHFCVIDLFMTVWDLTLSASDSLLKTRIYVFQDMQEVVSWSWEFWPLNNHLALWSFTFPYLKSDGVWLIFLSFSLPKILGCHNPETWNTQTEF